jgi:hypothetical protein
MAGWPGLDSSPLVYHDGGYLCLGIFPNVSWMSSLPQKLVGLSENNHDG